MPSNARAWIRVAALVGWAVMALPRPGMAAGEIETVVRLSYPSVLGHWAAGDSRAALDALADMEVDLTSPEYRPRDVEVMWRAKLGVLRDLMGVEGVDVLPPVMMLHHDAYVDYLAREEPILAAHSRVMAEELAQVYARQRPDEAGRRLASAVLTSLAGHLQHGWSSRGSALLFTRAIDVDAGADAAFLGLGALYEKRAEAAEAAEQFGKAVAARSDSGEARLRLGVNLKRGGRLREAEEALRRLIDAEALPWVEVVAFQELGDLLGRRGDDPLPLLRRAVEKHPTNSRLKTLLAFWLERADDPAESYGMVEEALLITEPEPESPRYQYSRWPLTRLEAVRDSLRAAVAEHRAILADGVQALRTGNGGAS